MPADRLTPAKQEQLVEGLAAGETLRSLAPALGYADHSALSKRIRQSPDLLDRVRKAERRHAARLRDAERKAAAKIRRANGQTSDMTPEHRGAVAGRTPETPEPSGWNRRSYRGGRVLRVRGASRAYEDWCATTKDADARTMNGLLSFARYADDGRELERQSVEPEQAQRYRDAGWRELPL